MTEGVYNLTWAVALVVAITGVVAIGFRLTPEGWWLLAIGGSVLGALAIRAAWQSSRAGVAQPVGGLIMVGVGSFLFYLALVSGTTGLFAESAFGSLSELRTFMVRAVLLITGLQALFLAVNVRISGLTFNERVIYPIAGHVLLLIGSAVLLSVVHFNLSWTPINGAILVYAVGFSALALHTFWLGLRADAMIPPRPKTVHRFWEQALIFSLVIGIVSVSIVSISMQSGLLVDLLPTVTQARVASIVAVSVAVIAVATLAAPANSPPILGRLTGPISTILQQSLTIFLLANAVVLAFLLWVPEAFLWILGGYLALLLVGVVVEYGMVGYAYYRRKTQESAPTAKSDPILSDVTVVISAFNEGKILAETIEQNLTALGDLPIVLVPATKSTDETLELAHQYQSSYPTQIRVVEGTTGSKAGDLNLVWDTIETPYVLLLDADETADGSFVSRGLAILDERPSVGIVQGRKVERYPDGTRFVRFVTTERRHSTWMDHPFMHDMVGASHFAGSAALLRHEVPLAVGGWSEDTLTEDIDLTLRLYLETGWRVAYVPDMQARVFTPKTFLALVRQRRRWARGWAQATMQHGIDILRAGRTMGWPRSFGLLWVLITSINAPLYTVFPAIIIVWLLGLGADLPLWLVASFGLIILPAKAIAYGYAAWSDPAIPIRRNPIRIAEVVVHAYLWILATWIIQLHALYLHLAGAPKIWEPTTKADAEWINRHSETWDGEDSVEESQLPGY